MNNDYLSEYNRWLIKCDVDSKKQLLSLSSEEIEDAFYKELSFGTAGMRGIIGLGTNRMNKYTIRKANYGYGKFLKDKYKENISIVIARDNRFKSDEFMEECIKVLSTFNIKCYIFEDITPTPILSFAIRNLNANGGIVITASHNSKEYNGYKIYDENGCQLIPEYANKVIDNMKECPDYFDIQFNDLNYCKEKKLYEYVPDYVIDNYMRMLLSIPINDSISKENFKIIFSSLHGTTGKFANNILKKLNYEFKTVEEQLIPDPNFSTVCYPNPEDINALSMSIEYAKKYNADICFATDPDGDRIGIAVKNNKNEYILLNGNKIGIIIFDYLCKNKDINGSYIIDTIVSSRIIDKIAKKHNINHLSTYTGFKFIGSQIDNLIKNNKKFIFGFEESYGYLLNENVRDKDALQALVILSEIACKYKSDNLSLIDVLDKIYLEYGYFKEQLISITLDGSNGLEKINEIMNYFRNYKKQKIGNFEIINKIDYYNNDLIVNGINLGKSNILEFNFDNSYVIFRPSGTEPKIKAYIGSCSIDKDNCIYIFNKLNCVITEIIKNI